MKKLIAPLLALGLAACSAAPDTVPPPPAADPPLEASLTAGQGALDLFALLDESAGASGNVFYSPASIEQAFGLLALGADGDTLDQIETTLPPPRDARFLSFKDDSVEVRLANALWLSQGWRFRESYVAAARDRYDATAQRVDFQQREEAARRINDWADKATDGLIPKLTSPDAIDPETVALLSNALFFDAEWETYFDSAQPQKFLFGDGHEEDFVLMRETMALKHASEGDLQAVRLPYRNTRYAMDVIMPRRRWVMQQAPELSEIAEIARKLDAAEPQITDMRLPRFEIDYKTALIEPLRAIGLTLPFDRDRANLSRMVEPGQRQIYVDQVQHLAKLQVFSEGTKAAAVTTIRIVPVGARRPVEKPREFIVDRPFAIVIRDLETGAILFLGRIADPQAFIPIRDEPE